ncbi:MAG: ammonium transporter [Candidatus Marinarcus sp.]|uniref:ammonium transporter n=1 Tax=Candidatus Marinarcus sp. TaxID=3100987 RepID=UPI003B00CE61
MYNYSNIDVLWILVCAFLVFLMQFGFALIETGTVRSKNTINVAMKNLIDTIFGVMFFWIIGFGLMFGTDVMGLFGTNSFLIDGKNYHENAFFFFQAMFAATAITIVSGAVAERIKFNGYIVVAIIVTSVIYPIFGHWAWSEHGWLKTLGFLDFAGSTVVHSMGGWIGLAGAMFLGPRLGKFRKGEIIYFAPSNHNMIVFGVFILTFAWFGFNAGSLLRFDGEVTAILLNTLLAATFGGFGGWLISLINKEKVGVEIFSFGVIAGLVGITAGCDRFDTMTSAFVGLSSAFLMHIFDQFLLKKLKIDDPLSVVSIHGVVGVWGTLSVGFFSYLPEDMTRLEFIGVQALGVVVAFIVAMVFGLLLFYCLYKLNLLRVAKKHEVLGLNVSEHNAKLPWVETIESIVKIMRTGNIKKKIYEDRNSEIGLVAKFFNYLLDILRKKQIELRKSNSVLKIKSEIDPLTQILNRRALMEYIVNKNFFENTWGMIIIDIDKFKSINDTYGHNVGDIVLKELSKVVSNNIREQDIFARWGGEEFVLVIEAPSISHLELIAEKARVAIEKHEFDTVKKVTASLGICFPKNANESFETIFEHADAALYQAKKLGRNRVCSW